MTVTQAEQNAMSRALALAALGPRGVNPQVGAVILSPAGETLAEGWHRGAGAPHAEVDALTKLSAAQTSGATAVVTLEPCNHTGRTGPCSLALIEAGVARVVYALDDPGRRSGGGAERMRAAGLAVESGVDADAAMDLIGDWIRAQVLSRPFVTVKWAQSLDGRAAAADGTSKWITGAIAREDVHHRRSRADAIVVGTGTVIADDPALTARQGVGLYKNQPRPVVIGRREVPAGAAVLHHPHALTHIRDHNLDAAVRELHSSGVQTVFVEGGPTLASAFIAAGLADEFLIYVAPALLGGSRVALDHLGIGTIADAVRLSIVETTPLGEDILFIARARNGAT